MKKKFIHVTFWLFSLFGVALASCIPNKIQDLTLSFRLGNVDGITDSDIKINGPLLKYELMSFIEHDKKPHNDVFAFNLVQKKILNIYMRQLFANAFLRRLENRLKDNGSMDDVLLENFMHVKKDIEAKIKETMHQKTKEGVT